MRQNEYEINENVSYFRKKDTKITITRTNYGKVISLLYKALYSDYKLSNDDLKIIINYIVKEYI